MKKKTGHFQTTDGTSLFYETRGAGEAIVFVYGIACLTNHWHHQVQYFSKNYQTVVFDLRGHHKSSIPAQKENLTIAYCAQDVLQLMKHLEIEKVHLVGHSFGVPTALVAAAELGDRLQTLTLINGFAENPIHNMFGLDVIEPLYHFVSSQYGSHQTVIDSLWPTLINNPLSMWAAGFLGGFNLQLTQFKDIEIYARGVSQIPLEAFLPLFGDMIKFNGYETCKKISAPALVVAGEQDKITPIHMQEKLAGALPQGKFVRVPYGSHCTQLDFPDYVNLLLEKHFSNKDYL